MALNLTAGNSLATNATPTGYRRIHINEGAFESVTESSGSITAITISGSDQDWYVFEAAQGEGSYGRSVSKGNGGVIHNTTITYKYGGLSQAQLTNLKNLTDSQNMCVVLELLDGTLILMNRIGMNAFSSEFASGTSADAGTGVGDTVTLTGSDYYDMQIIDLGSNANLAAITQ